MRIKIKYIRDVLPPKATANGDWTDLRAGVDVDIPANTYTAIPLGVAMQLPAGYEAVVAPRSSTFKRWGLLPAGGIGIIDESYCGDNDEWHFLCYATRDTHVGKNDRICQFRVFKHQPTIMFEAVESLNAPDRGGIGSTGVE